MRNLLLVTFMVWVGSGLSLAQNYQPFLSAIKHYESQYDIRFSYDPVYIEQIERTFDTDLELQDFVAQVEHILPFKIQMVTAEYYTIAIAKSKFTLNLSDSLGSTNISPPFFFLINGTPASISIDNGLASFWYKPNLSDTLVVYAPGYEKKLIPVKQLINQKNIDLALMTQTFLLKDVLIEDYITKGINMDPASQKITIEVKDLPLLPGETDGDIFASLAALPGITTPDGRPGNLFIRGNSVDQSLVLFDNIPIYHRGHYFGTISPYNPKVVENVEVYRSGYHPRMGGRVGGAVFINSDAQVSNESQKGVGMNTLYAMTYVKAPLIDKKLGITLGARRSYPTSIKSPKLNAISESVFSATALKDANGNLTIEPDVIFHDYHSKLIYRPNKKHKVSASGIYSNTNLKYDLPQSIQAGSSESIDYENYGINTEWKYKFSEQWTASLINTYSKYAYNNTSTTPVDDLVAINDLTDYNSRVEISKNKSSAMAWQFGLDYKWQSSSMNYRNILQVSQTPIDMNFSTTAHTFSPFANLEWIGTERWMVQLGLRGSYFSPTSSFQWSPRLAVNYDLTSAIRLKATGGLYHQYLSQVKNLEFGGGGFDNELWMLTGEMNGSIISGAQYMGGFIINDDDWLLDVEGYYKTANNITYYEDRRFNENSIYFTADDLVFGVDTYFKRNIGEYTSAWAGYSYSNTQIKLDTTDQVTYKSKYVQPHVTYLGIAYNKDRWKFSAVGKYGSGLNAKSLEIAFAEVIYQRAQANRPPGRPPAPNPFVDVPGRYPSIWSMDLSASYKIPRTDTRKWSASFGVSVINLFDRSNLIDRAFRGNPPPPEFVDREALGFAPNLMVMIEW